MPNNDDSVSPSEHDDREPKEPSLKKLKSADADPEPEAQNLRRDLDVEGQSQGLLDFSPTEESQEDEALGTSTTEGDELQEVVEAEDGISSWVTEGSGARGSTDVSSTEGEIKEGHDPEGLTGDMAAIENVSGEASGPVSETSASDRRVTLPGKCGTSSTAFIGPKCRSEYEAPKTDIEDKLNEFYRELEQIEPGDSSTSEDVRASDGSSRRPQRQRGPRADGQPNAHKNHKPSAHRRSRPYRDQWQDRRYRPNDYGPGGFPSWDSPEPPYHQPQWEQAPLFIVPQGPLYPRFQKSPYCGPPNFPPQPAGPFYPPGYTSPMNSYYDYSRNDGSWQWEGAEFPSASGCPEYDGQDVYYDGSQRFVGSVCRPHGYRNYPSSNGNGFSYCGEEAWSHPPEPRASDGFQSGQRQEERYPGPEYDKHSESSPVLILMRGLPGSGKSTRAQELLSSGPDGIVLSTDDYFCKEKGYTYDSALLGEAHDWNHNRAREALDQGRSPVIIDNTNLQAWEMKPYVELALERGYRVEFHEPDTSWKSDPLELEKRNKHGVPGEKISHMLERFERPVSVDIVLNSQEPTHKTSSHHRQRNRVQKPRSRRRRRNPKRKGQQKSEIAAGSEVGLRRRTHSSSASASSEEEGLLATSCGEPAGGAALVELSCEVPHVNFNSQGVQSSAVCHDPNTAQMATEESYAKDRYFSWSLDRIFAKLYSYFGKPVAQNSEEADKRSGSSTGNKGVIEESKAEDHDMVHKSDFKWTSTSMNQDKEFKTFEENETKGSGSYTKQDKVSFAAEVPFTKHCGGCTGFQNERDRVAVLKKSKKLEQFILSDMCHEDSSATNASEHPKTKGVVHSKKHPDSSEDYTLQEAISSNNDCAQLHIKECSHTQVQEEKPWHSQGDDYSTVASEQRRSNKMINARSSALQKFRWPYSIAPTFHFAQERNTICRGIDAEENPQFEDGEQKHQSQIPTANLQVRSKFTGGSEICRDVHPTVGVNHDTIRIKDGEEDFTAQSAGSLTESTEPCQSVKENGTAASQNVYDEIHFDYRDTEGMRKTDASSDLAPGETDVLSSVFESSSKEMCEPAVPGDPFFGTAERDSERDTFGHSERQRAASTLGGLLGICLSLELALQLEELFGPIGVELDSLLPEDYIVPLDWKLSQMIHLQWKKTLEGRRKYTVTK